MCHNFIYSIIPGLGKLSAEALMLAICVLKGVQKNSSNALYKATSEPTCLAFDVTEHRLSFFSTIYSLSSRYQPTLITEGLPPRFRNLREQASLYICPKKHQQSDYALLHRYLLRIHRIIASNSILGSFSHYGRLVYF